MKKTQPDTNNIKIDRAHTIPLQLSMNELEICNFEDNTPLLLKKKRKNIVIKPLTYIRSDTGKTRHFTPASQEWYNSIYSYNKNSIKTLSIADKNLMYLLKSYFNSKMKHKIINTKRKNKEKPMLPILRRLSGKRVFIGKGDLKHTSARVIITFYVYNTESMFLVSKFMQFQFGLGHFIANKLKLKKTETKDTEGNIKITYNRLFNLKEYINWRKHYEWYLNDMINIINKQSSKLKVINKYYKKLKSLVWDKLLSNDQINLMFYNKTKHLYYKNYPSFNSRIIVAYEEYRKNLDLYKQLVEDNKFKFQDSFMSKLIDLIEQIYNKKVQLNIVNLKKMHLNSDIYTQAVSLKLRNRDNKLYRVLKASLRKIKLPVIRKIDEKQKKPNRDEFFVNRIRNNTISTMFSLKNKKTNINDRLQNLLLKFYPLADNLNINYKKRSSNINRTVSLENFVLKSLKHLNLRGIRVVAKGRLTRRFTASRSVLKRKWKGGLKNVDSSFRGLSTIMLRGIVKSNLQYSVINSKNRNGAYGVKGWVSSK
jgi:hypothetical protein